MKNLKIISLFLLSIFPIVSYANSNSYIGKSPELLWQWEINLLEDKFVTWTNITITYDWITWKFCNDFTMDYKLNLKNETITSLDTIHTEVYCDWILNKLEDLFFNLSWNKYEYENDSIKIFTNSGIISLVHPNTDTSNPKISRCILDWWAFRLWNCEFEDGTICNIDDYYLGKCKKTLYSNIDSEILSAYNWSYSKWITTMQSVSQANMDKPIIRAELAKMISNYAMNILWMQPDTSKTCYFLNSNINSELAAYVIRSCQLWLMWQWISDFRPNDTVTRAEFWTVLSRTLRWNENEWWSIYYENHLKMLKLKWIMNKIDFPLNKEIRGYVMLMLMRADKMFY